MAPRRPSASSGRSRRPARLAPQVALADDLAASVHADLARDVHRLAAGRGDHVGPAERGPQLGRIVKLDFHLDLLSRRCIVTTRPVTRNQSLTCCRHESSVFTHSSPSTYRVRERITSGSTSGGVYGTSQSGLVATDRKAALDDPSSSTTFTARLAKENGWKLSFARRVVEEYRRFLFLAAAAEHPVSPPDAIDQAWHLHLLYTRSYWENLFAIDSEASPAS